MLRDLDLNQFNMKPRRSSSSSTSSGSNNLGAAHRPKPRKGVRPVDRQKMRPWLEDFLNSNRLQSHLWWLEPGKKFCVKWPHANRHNYQAGEEAKLFKEWALHTGIYKEGDQDSDHRKWKSNFRCAVRSLPDVKEVGDKNDRRGNQAFRTYEFLDSAAVKKKKGCRNAFVVKEEDLMGPATPQEASDSDSGASSLDTETVDRKTPHELPPMPPRSSLLLLPPTSSTPEVKTENLSLTTIPVPCLNANIPDFESLGVSPATSDSIQSLRHLSGGSVVIKIEPRSNDDRDATLGSSSGSLTLPTTTKVTYPVLEWPNTPKLPLSDAIELIQLKRGPQEEDMMIPVGICVKRRRVSVDSGHPESPPNSLDFPTGDVAHNVELLAIDDNLEEVDYEDITAFDHEVTGSSPFWGGNDAVQNILQIEDISSNHVEPVFVENVTEAFLDLTSIQMDTT